MWIRDENNEDFVTSSQNSKRDIQYNQINKLAWLDGSSGKGDGATVNIFSGFQGIHSLPGLYNFVKINANRGKKNLGVGMSDGRVYGNSQTWTGAGTAKTEQMNIWNSDVNGYFQNGVGARNTGIGLNSYVNVLNATSWDTLNKATVGGAISEAVRQTGAVNANNNTVAWFSGNYGGSFLNTPEYPYAYRGSLSEGVFYSSAWNNSEYPMLTRPLRFKCN